jgi:hypothetical protein
VRPLGWGLFALAFAGEVWTAYNGTYGPHLFTDLHNHPYYKTAREVAAKTPPNSVVVVFGTNWGADVPFYARRRIGGSMVGSTSRSPGCTVAAASPIMPSAVDRR